MQQEATSPIKTCNVKHELLETIRTQDEVIHQQAETILMLVNENIEQENLINELLKDFAG